MAKRALMVGINYKGTPHELRGCVNDVNMVSEVLTREFGFTTKEKRMLTDESATTANILERLEWLVNGVQPGDFIHFHYSGHGSQMIDSKYDTDDEPDGLDEIICPVDLDWRTKVIKDDDLKRIFDKVPAGAHLSIVLDCCHSGSGIDQTYHYRPLGIASKGGEFSADSPNKSRLLPMPADIENRGMGLNLQIRPRQARHVDQTGMLLSGCQSHQTSADAWINNMYCGAATFAFLNSLASNDYNVSYKDLIDSMNNFMVTHNFTQRPELNGSEDLVHTKVLGGTQVVEVIPEPEPETVPNVPETVPEVPDKPEDEAWKKNLKIMLAVVAAIVAALLVLM